MMIVHMICPIADQMHGMLPTKLFSIRLYSLLNLPN